MIDDHLRVAKQALHRYEGNLDEPSVLQAIAHALLASAEAQVATAEAIREQTAELCPGPGPMIPLPTADAIRQGRHQTPQQPDAPA